MKNPDVDKVVALVKEQTGYEVSVTPDPSLSTNVAMRSATAQMPGHIVLLNPKCERFGDFLVALQCAMLLLKWRDRNRIPDFMLIPEKVQYFEAKGSNDVRKLKLPEQTERQDSSMLVQGLLQQLNSVPCSILGGEWCYANCPNLRSEQGLYMGLELRQNSASLAPAVKTQTPRDVFEKSVTMSAAYALWWSDLGGEHLAPLPYESLGYTKGGRELLALLRAIPSDSTTAYVDAVNAWAGHLQLGPLVEWRYRRG
ncbi:MAG: hypothetical protein A3K19_19630 [Lentisphaerae bacterium RIFOXYB12_FULL_65_16]|nr:MAG: hypothetical protein A3K18_31185 [Lentisphaerae bacterium RIFOXYA12_64_32]OGV92074.1 MAG: hypothetical protein A3K19_19630 [Lentisphaerae bacterium RIFOXYB12_FULL_65_16]